MKPKSRNVKLITDADIRAAMESMKDDFVFDKPLGNGLWRVIGITMTSTQREQFQKELLKQGNKILEDHERRTDNNNVQ